MEKGILQTFARWNGLDTEDWNVVAGFVRADGTKGIITDHRDGESKALHYIYMDTSFLSYPKKDLVENLLAVEPGEVFRHRGHRCTQMTQEQIDSVVYSRVYDLQLDRGYALDEQFKDRIL